MILFDTGDGIPFDAMHKYGPISDRVIPCSSSSFPSTVWTIFIWKESAKEY